MVPRPLGSCSMPSRSAAGCWRRRRPRCWHWTVWSLRCARSTRAIVFTQSIVGAERAAARLCRAGLSVAAVHSHLGTPERREILVPFRCRRPAGGDGSASARRGHRRPGSRPGGHPRRQPKPPSDDPTDGKSVAPQTRRPGRPGSWWSSRSVPSRIPALGAHEGFLDEIIPVADAVQVFGPEHDQSDFGGSGG